jgi:hypothetical protein
LNFRIEAKEVYDYDAALKAIRWYWRLGNKSEAGRFAIKTMAAIAWNAGAPRPAGGHVPAPISESHDDAG